MIKGKAHVGFDGIELPSDTGDGEERSTTVSLEGFCQSPSGFSLPIRIKIDGTTVKTLEASGTETELEIALREIPFCDSDGTEYKILVFASQLYQVAE